MRTLSAFSMLITWCLIASMTAAAPLITIGYRYDRSVQTMYQWYPISQLCRDVGGVYCDSEAWHYQQPGEFKFQFFDNNNSGVWDSGDTDIQGAYFETYHLNHWDPILFGWGKYFSFFGQNFKYSTGFGLNGDGHTLEVIDGLMISNPRRDGSEYNQRIYFGTTFMAIDGLEVPLPSGSGLEVPLPAGSGLEVPLPPALWMLTAALGMLFGLRHRRRAV